MSCQQGGGVDLGAFCHPFTGGFALPQLHESYYVSFLISQTLWADLCPCLAGGFP